MLNRVLPGAGEALKMVGHAGNAAEMSLIAVVAVVEILMRDFEEMAKSAKRADEELATLLDEKYDAAAIRGVAKAWEDAATAQEIYRLGLAEKQQDENDPTRGAADRALRAAKSYETAQQQINDAQKKLGEASIEEMEKKGTITHQQALIAKLQLDEAYEKRRLELAAETDAKGIDTKQRTAAIVAKQKAVAEIGESYAEKISAKADADVAHVKMEISKTGTDKETGEKLKKESDVSQETADQIREMYARISGDASGNVGLAAMGHYLRNLQFDPTEKVAQQPSAGDMWKIARMFDYGVGGLGTSDADLASYESGEKLSKTAERDEKKLNDLLAKREHDAALAKHELERQKHLLDEKSAQLDKLQQELDTMKAEAQAREQNNATVTGIKDRTEAVKSGVAPPVNPFAPPPRAAAEPLPPSDTSYRAAEGAFRPLGAAVDINGLIAALHLNEQQKNTVLDHIHNVTKDSLAAWNSLERKWGELEQQIRNSSNYHSSG